ncbi:MAG: site-specific DNA-methyltransferase [Oscillospiraceae bacterium]|nr:site-specific DNA-methyltransferase [Oscillospiraceae bacterium]
MKAPKNKTIDLSVEEGAEYLARCIRVEAPAALNEVLDRTILGDCLAVLPMLPRGFADLLIADPPYNLDKDFHGSRFSRMDDAAYEAYTIQWLDAALPCLKPDGSVYVCCDWRSGAVIGRVLESRLHVRNRITWQREKGRGAKKNWKNSMEDIWFATLSEDYSFDADAVRQRRRVLAPYREKGQPKDWQETKDGRFRDTAPSNFWDDISIPYWSMPENTAHPTQKPEKLMAKLVLASCPKGGTVLDPFLGSGSSAVTAKKLGRHFVGIEQNPRYCVWCEKRLELAESNPGIQGYADGVFWERNTFALQKRAESE